MDDFDKLMEIQRFTASRIRHEAEVDNKIIVLNILSDLSSTKGPKVQIEELMIEASAQGLTESDVTNTIDALKKDDLVIEPEQGYVQLT